MATVQPLLHEGERNSAAEIHCRLSLLHEANLLAQNLLFIIVRNLKMAKLMRKINVNKNASLLLAKTLLSELIKWLEKEMDTSPFLELMACLEGQHIHINEELQDTYLNKLVATNG
ncbi:hypothetical protein AVEN_268002-1 [Araneus ventricosus]|uniref:Uncharacterized protein n=1 Tax=Araneus ventricosus TaxID=182803 RepID=A0A4Y2JB01_ARAVE|nr:hypothetical protein AVEN_268002-1 [Araneus ventricosus]